MWTTDLLERVSSESWMLAKKDTTMLVCTTVFTRIYDIPKDWIVHTVHNMSSKHITNNQITGISSFFTPISRIIVAYPVKPNLQYESMFNEVIWFIPKNVGVTVQKVPENVKVVYGETLDDMS